VTNSEQNRLFPIVQCPGCKTQMDVMVVESGPNDFHTVTYRCERCGTETPRTFMRGELGAGDGNGMRRP